MKNLMILGAALIISSISFVVGTIFTCEAYEESIFQIKKQNKEMKSQLTILATQLINSNDRECQYYIEKTDDGFIIDGTLYRIAQ